MTIYNECHRDQSTETEAQSGHPSICDMHENRRAPWLILIRWKHASYWYIFLFLLGFEVNTPLHRSTVRDLSFCSVQRVSRITLMLPVAQTCCIMNIFFLWVSITFSKAARIIRTKKKMPTLNWLSTYHDFDVIHSVYSIYYIINRLILYVATAFFFATSRFSD